MFMIRIEHVPDISDGLLHSLSLLNVALEALLGGHDLWQLHFGRLIDVTLLQGREPLAHTRGYLLAEGPVVEVPSFVCV